MKGRDEILQSRWIRPVAHLLTHPALWRLSRRSVPRALALGLFAAFIIPVGQFLLAALLAVPTRANVPLAAAATLVTNPLTFPAIYFAAYKVGSLLVGHSPGVAAGEAAQGFGSQILEVSGPTALGLLVFAVSASILGYVVGDLWWRLRLARLWHRRGGQSRE